MNTKQANRASWSKMNVKRKRKSRTHLSHKKQSSKRQKIVEIQDNDDHVEKELVNSSPVNNKDSRLSTFISKPLKKGILRNKQDITRLAKYDQDKMRKSMMKDSLKDNHRLKSDKEQKTLQRRERDSSIDESDKESNSDVIVPDLNNNDLKSSKLRKCERFLLYGFTDSEENKSPNYRWFSDNSSNPMNACDEVYENNDKLILTESKSWLQNTAGSQNDIEKLNDDNDKWDLNYKVGLASSILTDGQKILDTTSNHKIIVEEDKKEAKEFINNIKFSTKPLKDIASSYNKFKYEISDDKFVIQNQPKRQISFKESRRIVNNQITSSQKNLLAMFRWMTEHYITL